MKSRLQKPSSRFLSKITYKKNLNTSLSFYTKWLKYYYQIMRWFYSNPLQLKATPTSVTNLTSMTSVVSETNLNRRNLWHFNYKTQAPNNNIDASKTNTWSSQINQTPRNFRWFKDYWILHQSKTNSQYSINRNFKTLFFICNDNNGLYNIIGIAQFYKRWSIGLNLLFNLTFFNAKLNSFSNKIFVEESLVYNWNVNLITYKIFRFSQNVIYFKDVSYGEDTKLFYLDSPLVDLDAALIIDVKSHEKNIFFLRTFHIFRLGLLPANYNPWLLTYSIPLLGDSLVGQYYFFNLMIQLTSISKGERYFQTITRWRKLVTLFKLVDQFERASLTSFRI